jgi:hypothetical protein
MWQKVLPKQEISKYDIITDAIISDAAEQLKVIFQLANANQRLYSSSRSGMQYYLNTLINQFIK